MLRAVIIAHMDLASRGDGVQVARVGTNVKRDCSLAVRHSRKEAGIMTTFSKHLKILDI